MLMALLLLSSISDHFACGSTGERREGKGGGGNKMMRNPTMITLSCPCPVPALRRRLRRVSDGQRIIRRQQTFESDRPRHEKKHDVVLFGALSQIERNFFSSLFGVERVPSLPSWGNCRVSSENLLVLPCPPFRSVQQTRAGIRCFFQGPRH
ncbi:hypothetical protein LZ31DRAFT_86347 [Colletotrichum somersetense]|nr:hypothetical protein LZ31DRAFT_86347 [Colletotrichum somersetense]